MLSSAEKPPHYYCVHEGFNIEEGRYIILGSIDGLLATLGIIIGVSVVSASNAIIVSAALGGAIALALTNGVGSYLAESTIEHGKLAMTEKSLLRKLNNTYVEFESVVKDRKGRLISRRGQLYWKLNPVSTVDLFSVFGCCFGRVELDKSGCLGNLCRVHFQAELCNISGQDGGVGDAYSARGATAQN